MSETILLRLSQRMATHATVSALAPHEDEGMNVAQRTRMITDAQVSLQLADRLLSASKKGYGMVDLERVLLALISFISRDLIRARQSFSDGASSAHMNVSQLGRLPSLDGLAGAYDAFSSFMTAIVIETEMRFNRPMMDAYDTFTAEFDTTR